MTCDHDLVMSMRVKPQFVTKLQSRHNLVTQLLSRDHELLCRSSWTNMRSPIKVNNYYGTLHLLFLLQIQYKEEVRSCLKSHITKHQNAKSQYYELKEEFW